MSREIKFRAFDGEQLVYQNERYGASVMQLGDLYNKFPSTLMQFTGLKDINRVDIYEGDTVIYKGRGYDNSPSTIVFSGSSFCTKCDINGDLGDMYGFDLEVVGNIHENKELLK